MLLENVKIRAKNRKNIGLNLIKIELQALGLVLAAIVYLTINPWSDFYLTTDDLHLADQPSIFVSKLTNVSGNNEHEYLNYGITNAIITDLSSYSN